MTEESDHPSVHDENRLPTLFRHQRRAEWGLAVVVRQADDRAILQFQDGTQRAFHQDYFGLLAAVDRPFDETARVVDTLRSMYLGDEARGKSAGRRAPVSLDEQVAHFTDRFGSFDADEYVSAHRGGDRKRPLKRHRDASIAKAKKLLSKKALDGAGAAATHEAALEVLRSTDLVSTKERKAFATVDPAHHSTFAVALRELLHGDAPLVERFDRLARSLERALGEPPSWSLATSWAGFVHPKTHVIVRRDVFQRQVDWLAPGVRIAPRPSGHTYARLLGVAKNLRKELEDRELSPRDLVDVRELVWLTLKPAARREIEALRPETADASADSRAA